MKQSRLTYFPVYWILIGQFKFPVHQPYARRLISSLLYGTQAMLITGHSLWLFPWKQSVWQDPNQERTNQNAQISLKTTLPYDNVVYYMASSMSGKDEPNHKLWLATQASKMEPSCPLGTTRCIPQAKFPLKPYNKSFLDQVRSVKMAGYWPRSFLRVYGPRLRLGP